MVFEARQIPKSPRWGIWDTTREDWVRGQFGFLQIFRTEKEAKKAARKARRKILDKLN
jgi:hypothetical protein